MKIIKAKKKDLKEIAKLMLEEFSKPPWKHNESIREVLKSINFYFKIGEIYFIKINKEIMGIIVFKIEQYWEGEVIIIEDLVVKDKFKKQNIEKGLMKFVESYAKKKKIRRTLFTTNKKSKSVSFYKKIGYKIKKNVISMFKDLK